MPDKLRVGFIGCGNIANRHVKQFSETPEAEIVALCDTQTAGIERIKEQFPFTKDLPVFTDYHEMFDKAKLDVVCISTPHTLHFQHIMDSLDRGLHVAVEKPMACTVQDAKKIVAKVEETGLKLSITYQRRHWPEFLFMKKYIEEGNLGTLKFIAAIQCQGWFHPGATSWRFKPELSGGGQLNDSGSHMIDSLLYITGLAAEEVYAVIDNRGCAVDINSALVVKFKGGAQASISVMGDAPTPKVEENINISGDKAILLYHDRNIKVYNATRTEQELGEMPTGTDPDRNLINAILGREEILGPATAGLRVIELTEAAWKSGETGCPVKVESL